MVIVLLLVGVGCDYGCYSHELLLYRVFVAMLMVIATVMVSMMGMRLLTITVMPLLVVMLIVMLMLIVMMTVMIGGDVGGDNDCDVSDGGCSDGTDWL